MRIQSEFLMGDDRIPTQFAAQEAKDDLRETGRIRRSTPIRRQSIYNFFKTENLFILKFL